MLVSFYLRINTTVLPFSAHVADIVTPDTKPPDFVPVKFFRVVKLTSPKDARGASKSLHTACRYLAKSHIGA